MKNVLFLTDFSMNSIHAIRYGINLTDPEETNYYIFHSFTFKNTRNNFSNDLYDQYKSAVEIRFNHLKESLQENHGQNELKIECFSEFGFIPDSLVMLTKDLDIDLVVMGMSGMSYFNIGLFGNKAYETMKTLKIPVLTVPLETHLSQPTLIGLVSEEEHDGWEERLDPVYEIHNYCQSEIMGIQIVKGEKEMVLENSQHFDTSSKLQNTKISNPDILLGIKNAIGEMGIDLLVLIRKERSFFENLFHKSISKQIASKIDLPILTISE